MAIPMIPISLQSCHPHSTELHLAAEGTLAHDLRKIWSSVASVGRNWMDVGLRKWYIDYTEYISEMHQLTLDGTTDGSEDTLYIRIDIFLQDYL